MSTCKRDVVVRDRDETETETFPHFAETEMLLEYSVEYLIEYSSTRQGK